MRNFAVITAIALMFSACGVDKKLNAVRLNEPAPVLSLPSEDRIQVPEASIRTRDTIKVQDFEGREVLIMKAVRDEDGEMVATDVLDAAMVTAKFRNVAERNGKVDLKFRVTVPELMQDSKWQLRFYPDMFIMGDTVRLDPVIITGYDYRQEQLRGYQRYQRFIEKIIDDPELMLNSGQLEIFIERNLPEIYGFKSDSSYVSEELFYSHFGVTEQDAIEHYTNRFKVWYNERRKSLLPRKYRQFVKSPIVSEGLRLDTVIRDMNGDFIYDYVQTVRTRPQLRKVDIVMSGQIFEQDQAVYTMPDSGPLTFYISSLSSLADGSERYMTKVIERRAEANTACYIDFAVGRSDVVTDLGNNGDEIRRIKDNLASLARNEEYDLDSIVVTASASPEGSYRANELLAERRSKSVTSYFSSFLRSYRDSLKSEEMRIDIAGGFDSPKEDDIRFVSRYNAENWRMLDAIVDTDLDLGEDDKRDYRALSVIKDPDERERMMQSRPYYKYMRQTLYPRLRTVRFDFFLHRRGMIKDTVHTTVCDSAYMKGVRALKDRDYETAVTILRPYADFNAALAFCAMDYNASALELLRAMEKTAPVNYMMALVHSRRGEDAEAVQCYLNACAQDKSFVHRGNLDPEISSLISRYALDKRLTDENTQ